MTWGRYLLGMAANTGGMLLAITTDSMFLFFVGVTESVVGLTLLGVKSPWHPDNDRVDEEQ